jgi:hypothetical protein
MTHATKARTGTLDDIATDSHVFSIIAMDQRNTLRRMFTAVGLDASDDDLRTAKADVARVLTPAATGLLSDPTYGVPAIMEAKALAPDCGLLVAAKPSERRSYQGEPRTHHDPDLDAQWVLDQGGDALKFFVQLRADRPAPGPGEPDLVAETLAVCAEIIRDCRATGVPVVIENLVYARPGKIFRARPAKTPSSSQPGPSTTSTSTCSSSNIRVHRKPAGGWPRSSTGLGPSCPPACLSTSSPTSSAWQPMKAAHPVSSPAAPCGAKSSASSALSVRSSSPALRCRD